MQNTITNNDNFLKNKINLFEFDYVKMKDFFSSIGEQSFRADQIMKWIYHRYCIKFENMTNFKKSLQKKLSLIACIIPPKFIKEQKSLDGTIKWSVSIGNQLVETIYIPEKNRSTLCISSQIGCALNCKFCFTGKQGFNRNLFVSEIIGQVWKACYFIIKNPILCLKPITNIVLMGMGEPLLNFKNVVSAIKIMIHPMGFGFSKNKITLSTSGIPIAIDKLIQEVDINLAISLHASNNKVRSKIMPINKKYNIQEILSSSSKYLKKSHTNKNGITIEYVMLNNVNDSIKNAQELVQILSSSKNKINLIPWNYFYGSEYSSSSPEKIKKFADYLSSKNFIVTIRKNRGKDIGAACGQLKGLINNRKKIK
ncbi:23S rRNA (adenine(2503)-C(2))-methyltransferase RlmN [Buchnera aphidicola (Kurisakia onigurumii)]|uniref:23S rRNA (adenine(2503)-C(2))-methyltransferase RlmN n=1 Tax=Buchnera aphidicola TaxID=9 RepID=UPI0031B6C477